MKIKISDVNVQERMRQLDFAKVSEIADSIKEVGLLNAITIDSNFNLVAGWHRLEALKLLGFDEIDAEIKDLAPLKRELAEIDENLIRSELHYLDRGSHLARRKQIYELLHPETRAGGDRRSDEFVSKRKDGALKPSFATDTANKTGIGERTIQHDVQLATRLKKPVQEVVRELDLPKNEALHLVRAVPKTEDQLAVLDKIREKKARTVTEAKKIIDVEQGVEKGKRIEAVTDAEFKVADWRQELQAMADESIGAIITQLPPDLDGDEPQALLDAASRILVDGGKLVVQIRQDQIPRLTRQTTLPENMKFEWLYANLLQGSKTGNEYVSSQWIPIVTYCKGTFEQVKGGDKFEKAFESLTKIEDVSLQICTRFTKVGQTIVDPFLGQDLMSYIGASVGRKFIGIAANESAANLAKSKLIEVRDIVASI